MGKIKILLITAIFCLGQLTPAYGQVVDNDGNVNISTLDQLTNMFPALKLIARVVPVDVIASANPKLVAAIAQNTALQMSFENKVNTLTDSLSSVQTKTASMTLAMETIQKKHERAMQETSDFEEGSKFYDYVMTTVRNIVKQGTIIDNLAKKSSDAELRQKCLQLSSSLKSEARSLVDNYISVVTNGKAASGGLGDDTGDTDGYNTMSRKQRLDVANEIMDNLTSMHNLLCYVGNVLTYSTTFEDSQRKGKQIDFASVKTGFEE